MTSKDYIGIAGNPFTQGLGRLVSQYVNSPNLKVLLTGILTLANDLDLLFSRIQRIMNPLDDVTYDPGYAGVYPVNTQGAKTEQLKIIGGVVGVSNMVPAAGSATAPQTLSDAQFLKLVNVKIYRNYVRGCAVPQLLQAIQIVMPDLLSSADIAIEEIGVMTTRVNVYREVQNWEAGIFAIPSGQNLLKGAVLPRPMGVAMATSWWDDGCFTWGTEADTAILVDADGTGFLTDDNTSTSRWAETF
jgi:hypothetical protein